MKCKSSENMIRQKYHQNLVSCVMKKLENSIIYLTNKKKLLLNWRFKSWCSTPPSDSQRKSYAHNLTPLCVVLTRAEAQPYPQNVRGKLSGPIRRSNCCHCVSWWGKHRGVAPVRCKPLVVQRPTWRSTANRVQPKALSKNTPLRKQEAQPHAWPHSRGRP